MTIRAYTGDDAPAMVQLRQAVPAFAATGKLSASADFLGNGAIEINKYETEILDIVRRESPFLQRFRSVPSTGQPHRYFEETAIAQAQAVAITNGAALGTPTPSGPIRTERTVFIKALSAQTNISLFDADVTRQQGQFAGIEARDIADVSKACSRLAAQMIWNGSDTSLVTPTTSQYMGLLAQINQTSQIALGASIIDGIKSQVAFMAGNSDFTVRPTGIAIHPILGDYIDREAKATQVSLESVMVGGVQVKALATQAGILPLIPDPFLPANTASSPNQYGFTPPTGNNHNYFAVILSEDMVEMPFVHGGDGNPNPRIFQLGLVGGLLGQYVGVWFNSIVAKGVTGATVPSGAFTPANTSYAHAVVAVTRL
jgi:hypothetical protein